MTAAMTSLANFHGITFSFMRNIGGKQNLLNLFSTIKEQVLIKKDKFSVYFNHSIQKLEDLEDTRKTFNISVDAYLQYLARLKPDISQQIMVTMSLKKFNF